MKILPKKLFPFIWHYVSQQKWKFFISQIGALSWTLDHTCWPIIFMLLIDTFTNYVDNREAAFPALVPILTLGAILWIVVELGFRISGVIWAKAIPKLESNVRMDMFNYVQRHSHNYFSNQFAGTLANKINDMPSCLTRILQLIVTLFVPVLGAIIVSTTLFFFVSPLFAVILISWVFIHLLISFGTAPRCDALSLEHAEARSSLSGKIVDSLSNNQNVRLFARFADEIHFILPYQELEKKTHWDVLWFIEKIKFALGITSFLFPGVLITTFIIRAWLHNELTSGEVIFILNSSFNIMIMVWIAGLELPNLFKEIGVAKQALTLLQTPHEIIDKVGAKDLIVKKGEIRFDNVTFFYTPHNALFKNKTLTIHPGEKVGLVGFSGSGKTSFINLILRNFEVEKGAILIDEQNIADVTLESLRRAIAMIPQEPILFHRTLMENIRYGRLDATDEEVYQASIKAHCHDFIMKLPETYHTMVGERGVKLSGGQRQRIAIARAILKNASILILDEATSSLDSITEKHIQHDLADLMSGRTAIVIAHRLSTISNMDRILVFHNGEVVEEGSHEELLTMNGRYAEMWQMQAGGFLPQSLSGEEEDTDEDNTL